MHVYINTFNSKQISTYWQLCCYSTVWREECTSVQVMPRLLQLLNKVKRRNLLAFCSFFLKTEINSQSSLYCKKNDSSVFVRHRCVDICVCVLEGWSVCFLVCVVVAVPCSLLVICFGCTNDTWSHHLLSLQSRCCQNILLYFDDSSQWPAVYKRPEKVRGLALPAFHRNFFFSARWHSISLHLNFGMKCVSVHSHMFEWLHQSNQLGFHSGSDVLLMIHAGKKDGTIHARFYAAEKQQETFCVDVCVYSIRTIYYFSSICCSVSSVRSFPSGLKHFQCFALFFICDFGWRLTFSQAF